MKEEDNNGTTYYHGGQRGLKVGAFLLPPSITGAPATSDYRDEIQGGSVMRPDRVYITTSLDAAIMFGAMHPSKGSVYTVLPEGEVRHDPDCSEPGLSFECDKALIVSARNVTTSQRRRVLQAFGLGR